MIKRVGEPTLALRSFIHKFNSHRERTSARVSFGGSCVTPRCSIKRVVSQMAPFHPLEIHSKYLFRKIEKRDAQSEK